EVVAAQDGWMVIHAQKDGGIGPVIGHAPVSAGTNTDVVVTIDADAATETLYAMLHIDAGEMGTYEFPGPDGPVVVDGAPLAPAFMVTMPAPETLPVTGASLPDQGSSPLMWLGGLIALLLSGAALFYRRRTAA
ncbi:MAG: LPXTG cell wall anchor domain-containing protein, partial [Caldilineae bacterium]